MNPANDNARTFADYYDIDIGNFNVYAVEPPIKSLVYVQYI